MTKTSRASKSHWGVGALVGLTAAYALLRMFTGFSFYDDEGSLLLMSRWLQEGHPVYREFHSIYGPFYFLYSSFMQSLFGAPASHTISRLIAVVPWVLTCVLVFGYVLERTRSRAAALVAWLAVLRTLAFFTAEPGHPQEISVLLMVALVAIASSATPRRLAVTGALLGALLLTKINLGVFAGAAVLLVCVHGLPRGRWRYAAVGVVSVICAASPAVLMEPLLDTLWVRQSCVLIAFSIFGVIAVLWAGEAESILGRNRWAALILGFAASVTLVLIWAVGRGASLSEMAHSIVLDNLTQSHTWTVSLGAGNGGVIAGSCGVLVAALWLAGLRHNAFEWLRLGIGLATVVLVVLDKQSAAFAVSLPFVWMVMLPGAEASDAWPRRMLAAIAVMLSMAVYPVAGSQLRFTLVPLTIAGVLIAYDAWTVLTRDFAWTNLTLRRVEAAVALLALIGFVLAAGKALYYYRDLSPLELRGTSGIRVEPADGATYRWIVTQVRQSCDSLVSFPAMHSLYFWTGMIPPVYADVDGWQAYTNAQRQGVERRILASPRACVLVIDQLKDFWMPSGYALHSTLMDFIRENFREAEYRDGFHLLVRKP